MDDKKNILAKLSRVMKSVPYLQKDAKNNFHNYKYASELTIKTALHAAFVEHGIVFQLVTGNARIEDGLEPTRDGKVTKATLIDCVYWFWDVDSGESLTGNFVASGPARDDKGVWAATTNAIKYILTSTFLIPTGDDAESAENHPVPGSTTTTTKPATNKPPAQKAEPTATDPPPTPEEEFWTEFRSLCKNHKPEKLNYPQSVAGKAQTLKIYLGKLKALGLFSKLAKGTISPSAEMAPESEGWNILRALAIGEEAERPETLFATITEATGG